MSISARWGSWRRSSGPTPRKASPAPWPARSRRSGCPRSGSRPAAAAASASTTRLPRRPHDRVAELSYRIAADEVGHVRCDGLVAATPVGSTGYNLANQGPILAWGVKGYVVSYIAPHSLTARALVVAPADVLTVGNAADREPVEVALDGTEFGELASGEELEISFVESAGRLAQLPGTSFYGGIAKFGHLAVYAVAGDAPRSPPRAVRASEPRRSDGVKGCG